MFSNSLVMRFWQISLRVLCPISRWNRRQDILLPATEARPNVADKRCISAHYTLHTTHCTVHTTQYTLHTAHWTMHTAHYTLHTADCKCVIHNIAYWKLQTAKRCSRTVGHCDTVTPWHMFVCQRRFFIVSYSRESHVARRERGGGSRNSGIFSFMS